MLLRVDRSSLGGRVQIPGSKSHTIRAVALASLADGVSEIRRPLVSSDALSAAAAYRSLGAEIDVQGEVWTIKGIAGRPRVSAGVIDVGNSGTTLRLAVGAAALLRDGEALFTGDEQIRSRPLGPLLASLNDLGAHCESVGHNGKAPVMIRGTLRGGTTRIEAVTSQYLSSLLINTPLAQGDTTIEVPVLNEAPYVAMTLRYLDEQGIRYEHDGMKAFWIRGGQSYQPFEMTVPADWSSATFFLCAAAILGADLILDGLDVQDSQGDKAVLTMLEQMGAAVEVGESYVRIVGGELRGGEFDLNATPDALPALAVTGCFAQGETRLVHVPQARLKETDRIAVMAAELRKMGAEIEELPDGLIIQQSVLSGAEVRGHGDHRVVMALSLAGMAAGGVTEIDTAEAMNVTFPEYVTLMTHLGASMWVSPD